MGPHDVSVMLIKRFKPLNPRILGPLPCQLLGKHCPRHQKGQTRSPMPRAQRRGFFGMQLPYDPMEFEYVQIAKAASR